MASNTRSTQTSSNIRSLKEETWEKLVYDSRPSNHTTPKWSKLPKLGGKIFKTAFLWVPSAEGLGGDYNWDMHQMIQIWLSIDQELADKFFQKD